MKQSFLCLNSYDLELMQQLYLELVLEKMHPACVILAPVNATNSEFLFRQVSEKHIPVICFQRPSRSRFVEYFVGGDAYEQGVMQMEYVAKRIKGRGNVLLLEGDPYNDNARNMSLGNQEVLRKYKGGIHAEFISVSLWSSEEAGKIVAEKLASGQLSINDRVN